MKRAVLISTLLLAGSGALAGCAEQSGFHPFFKGIETAELGDNTVQFTVKVDDTQSYDMVAAYANCAAAGYALAHGAALAEHIRTGIVEDGDLLVGTAKYVISPDLPPNDLTIDANEVAFICNANRIPMV